MRSPRTTSTGVAVIDAPDIDSVERDNRELADLLLEAADLCVFVTTATRYADLVPWQVLRRAQERGLPLVVLLNRVPADERDREVVLADARRLLATPACANRTTRWISSPSRRATSTRA